MNPIVSRLLVIAGALVIWFWTQRLIGRRSADMVGIGDRVHQLTARWHRYFLDNEKTANRALALSSFFIDVLGLSLIALSVFGSTFKPFIAVMIVFILRQLCQMCSTLPPPPGIIWRDPGVPTLLVTYGVSNDFFFSGHTALAVLGAIEICGVAPWWLGAIVVCVALGEALIVLVLRAHYTLDVVTGAFAAWFAADMAGRIAPWVDGWMK
jgi:hypothetical protein